MELEATDRSAQRTATGPAASHESFEGFYAEHVTSTAAVVLALRGPRVGVEDVVQEAFVRALEGWGEVAAMERPDLWVQRVALNLATSRLRRLGAEARALARTAGRRDDPAGGLPDGDGQFWSAVRRLPAQQARAVALRYAADMPVADVAEVLGVAEGTVKAHLHRARARLAGFLSEDSAREETR